MTKRAVRLVAFARAIALAGCALAAMACSAAATSDDSKAGAHHPGVDGGSAGGAGTDASVGLDGGDDGAGGSDGGPTCDPSAPDLAACACNDPTAKPRACWPSSADPKLRGVGACKDGVQACTGGGEFHIWGPCVGATLPSKEDCANGADDDCNGLVDCADPSCASDAACQTPCTDGETRPCYDGTAATAGAGTCRFGTQTCSGGKWPADCPGEVLPAPETCNSNADTNCDGLAGCADPTCATDPACTQACQDGDTRPCYDGPPGTQNVGTCHGGTQTCTGGQWPATCAGEVVPATEQCNDLLDHNCNGFKGCDDFFACLLDNYCWGQCATPEPGCLCPVGTSDAATCPKGYFGTTHGGGPGTGLPPNVECCPCSASTCSNLACCGESFCSSTAWCSNRNCTSLPASCNGKVDFDCDFEDYDPNDSSIIPEDCDQPCCICRPGC
jgi:hypothetical protein